MMNDGRNIYLTTTISVRSNIMMVVINRSISDYNISIHIISS